MRNILLALLLLVAPVWADSPLTSTPFWKAYRDVPEVLVAHDIERLNTRLAYYLANDKIPIDKRAAVVNALSWNFEGKQNAMLYREVLGQKYKLAPDQVEPRLSAEETFCLAYLTALDDYFHAERSWKLMQEARRRRPRSFTVAMVAALVKGQMVFADQKKVYPPTAAVLADKQLVVDMRPQARAIILDYMRLYNKP